MSLPAIAGELAAEAMGRMLRQHADPPRSAIAWSTERVFEHGEERRYIQVVIYMGQAAPEWPDPAQQVIRDLPHFPAQGELVL